MNMEQEAFASTWKTWKSYTDLGAESVDAETEYIDLMKSIREGCSSSMIVIESTRSNLYK